jgi:hypothetical protein
LRRHDDPFSDEILTEEVLGVDRSIRLAPVKPDVGRPCFRVVSMLQPLALLEMDASSEGSEEGSSPFRWWRRRESVLQPVLSPLKLREMPKRLKRRTLQKTL